MNTSNTIKEIKKIFHSYDFYKSGVLSKNELNRLSKARKTYDKPVLIRTQEEATKIEKTKSNIWSGDCHNYCLIMTGGLDLVVEEGLSAYDILPLVPILESQDIIVTDWNSDKLILKEDTQYKYSTVVSRHNNIYHSAITLLK